MAIGVETSDPVPRHHPCGCVRAAEPKVAPPQVDAETEVDERLAPLYRVI